MRVAFGRLFFFIKKLCSNQQFVKPFSSPMYPYLQLPTPQECEGTRSGRHMLIYDEDGTFWCDACGRQYQHEDGTLVPYGQTDQ